MDIDNSNDNIPYTKCNPKITKVFLFCEEKNKKIELIQNLLFCSKQFHEAISILDQSEFSLEVMVKISAGYHKIFFLFQDLSKIKSSSIESTRNSLSINYDDEIFMGLFVENLVDESIKVFCHDIATYLNYSKINVDGLAGIFLLCNGSNLIWDLDQEKKFKNLFNGTLNSIFSIEKNKIKIFQRSLIGIKSIFEFLIGQENLFFSTNYFNEKNVLNKILSKNNNTMKKRKKLFRITKVFKKRSKMSKDSSKSKKLGSEHNEEIKKSSSDGKSIISGKSKNSSEEDKKENPNSLIQISKEVYNYLSQKIKAKGSNVTEHIINKISLNNLHNLRFKNIQRRVYDAINVMHAVGLISKNKSSLNFVSKSNAISKVKIISSPVQSQNLLKILKEKLNSKFGEINKKQHELSALSSRLYLSIKLMTMNKSNIRRRHTEEKLSYPFTLIKQGADASLVIKQDDMNSRICILSDRQLDIIYEEQIMKQLLQDDFSNIRNGIKKWTCNDVIEYLNKHQLIEKYFSNFSNFNSNSSFFKESFNTYTNLNRANVQTCVSPIVMNRNVARKSSLEFIEDLHSNVSNSELFYNNNFMLSYPSIDNNREDNLEDLISSNQMSTNFFSRNVKSSFEKFS